jgi:taurine dioxygenase
MRRFGTKGEVELHPLAGASFGGRLEFANPGGAESIIEEMESGPEILQQALYAASGLLMLNGLDEISAAPSLLLRLSRLFGPDIDNYQENGNPALMVHAGVPEIFVVSNAPPVNRWPPPRPNPPICADGSLPITFPHRRGWHSDQSFRRPPPDVSLLYAVLATDRGTGQTLFADCAAAFDALPPAMRARVEDLVGLHAAFGTGRSEDDVRNNRPVPRLRRHEQSQRQPVVRRHPVTGRCALYLCEGSQMDWVDGPFIGLEPGPDGAGADLLYQLMAHITQPQFVYVHDWHSGDALVFDNRTTIHAATWFDAERQQRTLWRTTVSGNPGPQYEGERPSWIPVADELLSSRRRPARLTARGQAIKSSRVQCACT